MFSNFTDKHVGLKGNKMTFNLGYGDFAVTSDKMHVNGLNALLTAGLAHKMGNEVASKVIGSFKAETLAAWKVANPGAKPSDSDKDAIYTKTKAANGPATPQYLAKQAAFRAEMWQSLLDGSVADSRGGPKLDPFATEVEKIATDSVVIVLQAKGLLGKAKPKADQSWTFGSGETAKVRTFADMVVSYLEKNRAKIEKEANAVLAERARRKAAKEKDASLGRDAEIDF